MHRPHVLPNREQGGAGSDTAPLCAGAAPGVQVPQDSTTDHPASPTPSANSQACAVLVAVSSLSKA